MSATYKLIGKRNLRKYTASKATPVYASESEVSYLSRNLCNVPWSPVSPKDASMTYHTNDIVYQPNPESAGVSGLDYNVMIRDGFDAALFCGGHVNETHRVYGNAACYKFTLPDMQTYPTLEKLKVNVTSDPYNSTGARIAIYTNSTGVIPTECATCRQGSAPSQSHSCTKAQGSNDWSTNDTYADAVAPREARQTTSGGKTSTSWYPVSGTCEFNPTGGLQLQKYLFVFVLLENYNVCRGNWIEGCSFIQNEVDVTLGSSVSEWDSRVQAGETVIDTRSEGSGEYVVLDGGITDVFRSGRKYVVVETPRCGVESPERAVYSRIQPTVTNAIAWRTSSPDTAECSFSGRVVGCTPLSITYIDVYTDRTYTLPTTHYNANGFISGGVIATYNPSNDGTGYTPGLSFYIAAYSSFTSSGQSAPVRYDYIPISPSTRSDAISEAAKNMLSSGSVKRLFLVPIFSWFNRQSVPSNLSALDRFGILVVLASDTQTEILGVLVNTGYKTKTVPTNGWALYRITNNDTFGDHGLVSCAFPYSRLRYFYIERMKQHCLSTLTFSDEEKTITYANEQDLPSKFLVYSWIRSSGDETLTLESNKAGVIGCYGKYMSVEPAGCFGGVETQTAYSTVVVCGKLSRVGSTPCKNIAYVDMCPSIDGSVTEAIVVIPPYDETITPVEYDDSFRVLPSTPPSDSSASDSFKAIISSKSGFRVGSSVLTTAKVNADNTLSAVGSVVNYGLNGVTRSEKFNTFIFGFSDYSAVCYGSTDLDSFLQQSSNSGSYTGLRNCFASWEEGNVRKIDAQTSGNRKVCFTINPTSRSLPITNDGGLTVNTLSFPIWRITASYILVPFKMPDASSMNGRIMRVSWSSVSGCTDGTVFNIWIRSGQRVLSYDDSLSDIRLYSAREQVVGEWVLVGSVPASVLSCEFDISGLVGPGQVATVLLTAWYPPENISLSTSPSLVGVGSLSVDPMTGVSSSSEDSGWIPYISIHD